MISNGTIKLNRLPSSGTKFSVIEPEEQLPSFFCICVSTEALWVFI